ncbi:hypothetical protein ACJX0J_032764 [Zea mays]
MSPLVLFRKILNYKKYINDKMIVFIIEFILLKKMTSNKLFMSISGYVVFFGDNLISPALYLRTQGDIHLLINMCNTPQKIWLPKGRQSRVSFFEYLGFSKQETNVLHRANSTHLMKLKNLILRSFKLHSIYSYFAVIEIHFVVLLVAIAHGSDIFVRLYIIYVIWISPTIDDSQSLLHIVILRIITIHVPTNVQIIIVFLLTRI